MKKNKGMLIVFMTPAVVMFVLVFLYPIIRTILMSFFKIEGITDPMSKWTFSGIDNYVKLANTTLFRISMWNLARIWFIGGIIVMSLAVALATMWLQYVYSPKYGLIKNFFQALGLDSLAKIQWLDNDHKFMALLLAYCFGMVGYHMLIFASGIERISDDYFEAATLDGANKFNQFRYITLPLLKGVFRTNVTMWSVTSVGFFVWSQLFSTVTADTQTITPMVYLYMQIFGAGNSVTERNSGVGAAVGVMLSVCVVIVFWLCNHLLQDKDLEF